jgi:imidazole glycerol-phosphate synthase subunit HisF
MASIRLIPRLDIKGVNLIKGIHLEGLRVIGDPQSFARKYYQQGADELIYMDVVASLYGRNSLKELVSRTAQDVFIPLTVGGGVRSVEDVRELLRAGADKVAINTAAVRHPKLISEIAEVFGSQCVVLSIEAKKIGVNKWEVFTDNGREKTGLDVMQWVKQASLLGAGEILLTSVDQEGTRKGFDVDLVRAVSDVSSLPLIASGGMGSVEHLVDVCKKGHADAVAIADMFHYSRMVISDLKKELNNFGLTIRNANSAEDWN